VQQHFLLGFGGVAFLVQLAPPEIFVAEAPRELAAAAALRQLVLAGQLVTQLHQPPILEFYPVDALLVLELDLFGLLPELLAVAIDERGLLYLVAELLLQRRHLMELLAGLRRLRSHRSFYKGIIIGRAVMTSAAVSAALSPERS